MSTAARVSGAVHSDADGLQGCGELGSALSISLGGLGSLDGLRS